MIEDGALLESPADISRGRRQAARAAGAQVDDGLLHRGGEKARFRVGVGGQHVDADHDVGPLQLRRRAELGAIEIDRSHQLRRSKVRGERVGQSERRGQLRAVEAGAENPDGYL